MSGAAQHVRQAFITGTAGFIGFHLAELLLQQGWQVTGYDGMTDYYDVTLKERRHTLLAQHPRFSAHLALLEDSATLSRAMAEAAPDVVVHLAAQAGVRYSLENPRAYIDANIIGTFNVMEAARAVGAQHLLMASTSSVYGGSVAQIGWEAEVPFPLTDLSCDLCDGCSERGEAIEHRDPDLELCDLTVEVPCAQALAQQLHAVHLGFDAASAVVSAPSSPDGSTHTF